MATELENLIVRLTGDPKGYISTLKMSDAASKTWASSVTRAVGMGSKIAFGLAAAAATAAAATIIKSWRDVAQTIDDISKQSRKLNVSTDALVGLRHAADLAGVATGTLDTSMIKLHRAMSDAAEGSTEAQRSFDALGLNVNDLIKLPMEERMARIADAMNGLKSQSDKVSVAFQLFGRGGIGMISMLEEGGDGLRAMMKDAKDLGLTFTSEQGKMVEAANDAMTRIGASIKGIKQQLVIFLAPAVKVVSDNITDWIAGFSESTGGAVSFARTAVNVFGKVADVIHTLKLAFVGLQASITSLLATVAEQLARIKDVGGSTFGGAINASLGPLGLLFGGGAGGTGDQAAALRKLADEQKAAFDKMFLGATPSESMASSLEKIIADVKAAAEATSKPMEDQESIMDDLIAAEEKRKQLLKEQEDLYKSMAQKAASLLEEQLSPIQKLRKEIQDVWNLERAGALTRGESGSIVQKMLQGFAGQGGTARATGGAAVEAGTREAYSLTRFGNLQRTTEKGVWEVVKKMDVSVKTEKDILIALKTKDTAQETQQVVSIP